MFLLNQVQRFRKIVLVLILANFGLIVIFSLVALALGGLHWPWSENTVDTFCLDHAPSPHSKLIDQQVSTFKPFSQPDLIRCTWHEAGRTTVTTFGSWSQTLIQTSLMYLVIWAQYSVVALVAVVLVSALVWVVRKIWQAHSSRNVPE